MYKGMWDRQNLKMLKMCRYNRKAKIYPTSGSLAWMTPFT